MLVISESSSHFIYKKIKIIQATAKVVVFLFISPDGASLSRNRYRSFLTSGGKSKKNKDKTTM
jgi:hypothetical protein